MVKMQNFINNIKTTFHAESEFGDNAGFIDEILFIVGIALAALAVSWWIGAAAMNKGADIAACIEGMNTSASSAASCNGDESHSSDNSFKKDETYTDRFGKG